MACRGDHAQSEVYRDGIQGRGGAGHGGFGPCGGLRGVWEITGGRGDMIDPNSEHVISAVLAIVVIVVLGISGGGKDDFCR